MRVEVVYALPDRQRLISLDVAELLTVGEAIEQSGILQLFPEIDLGVARVGIFSQLAALDDRLREGDRVEIYRPLIADPKAMRRERAAKKAAEEKKRASLQP
ncbi:MAG: RnfH family protein [Gammaproteobacteria bacterium]|nr:MAG: RnfH family protein [Gammaproteobacteria bacterium]RLA13370.1 MAG: RnfH family protein [Gammaproteobacteria bacterium]RLA14532.1 MAG: RnfH family protein [Gammaproteobacteria bacterium]